MPFHDFDATIVDDVAHRPWPLPERPWVMTQTWTDLLFAHWPLDPAMVRPLVPAVFDLDLFEARAWIAIVPFAMSNVGPRWVPMPPWASRFPELNVRTYVRVGSRPGVFFLSLDAGRWLPVLAARALLNLPYYAADMSIRVDGNRIEYTSVRGRSGEASFTGSYAPVGEPFVAGNGTLDHFLTERYCLYHTTRSGRPYRLEIHHPPWRLQRAHAAIARNTMAAVHGVRLPEVAPLLHFSKRQDVVAWTPERVDPRRAG